MDLAAKERTQVDDILVTIESMKFNPASDIPRVDAKSYVAANVLEPESEI